MDPDRHHPSLIRAVEYLLAAFGPERGKPRHPRYFAFDRERRKWGDVDFGYTGFVHDVDHELSIGGKAIQLAVRSPGDDLVFGQIGRVEQKELPPAGTE